MFLTPSPMPPSWSGKPFLRHAAQSIGPSVSESTLGTRIPLIPLLRTERGVTSARSDTSARPHVRYEAFSRSSIIGIIKYLYIFIYLFMVLPSPVRGCC
jgi:hypothetical protein